jgi:hypothetical protein
MSIAHTSLIEEVVEFQDLLIAYATGGGVSDAEYQDRRLNLVNNPTTRNRLPDFVRQSRELRQFGHLSERIYQERRELLVLLEEIEARRVVLGRCPPLAVSGA